MAVTDDMQFRLSQSVQKSLQMGKGLMFVALASPEGKASLPSKGGFSETENLKSIPGKQKAHSSKNKSISESTETKAPPLEGFGEAGVVMFSKQLMCLETSISYEEPSPNAFSFNSPYGACPTCKGLGSVYTIDMESVIPDGSKTVKEGGIAPLGKNGMPVYFSRYWLFQKSTRSI